MRGQQFLAVVAFSVLLCCPDKSAVADGKKSARDKPAAAEEARYLGLPTGDWIIQLANNPDAGMRKKAVQALTAIGPEAVKAVPALLQAMEDDAVVEVRLAP